MIFLLFRTWFLLMTDPELTLAEVHAVTAYTAVENLIFYLLFVVCYAAAHLLFSAAVHKRWDGERLRADDAPTVERKPYM